jgi:hypothetical protein
VTIEKPLVVFTSQVPFTGGQFSSRMIEAVELATMLLLTVVIVRLTLKRVLFDV